MRGGGSFSGGYAIRQVMTTFMYVGLFLLGVLFALALAHPVPALIICVTLLVALLTRPRRRATR